MNNSQFNYEDVDVDEEKAQSLSSPPRLDFKSQSLVYICNFILLYHNGILKTLYS